MIAFVPLKSNTLRMTVIIMRKSRLICLRAFFKVLRSYEVLLQRIENLKTSVQVKLCRRIAINMPITNIIRTHEIPSKQGLSKLIMKVRIMFAN